MRCKLTREMYARGFAIVALLALAGPAAEAMKLTDLTAVEVVPMLCSRNITAVEYATALLACIEEYTCINSFAEFDTEKVLADAAAIDAKYDAGESIEPLCGLPFVVKDNIDVAGYATTAGTPALQDNIAANDAPVVASVLEANGIVLGKTRMHELAYGGTTINYAYGPVLNPYNLTMHVGGSSGGTAAIVAARCVPAGYCSDTGGSCRMPAAATGIVGYRPTTGCWPGEGVVPMTTTRDTAGLDARTVADIIMWNDIVAVCPELLNSSMAEPVDLQGFRVGYVNEWWENLDAESEAVWEVAISALQDAGVEVVPVNGSALVGAAMYHYLDYEMPRELARYLYQRHINVTLPELIDAIASPDVKSILQAAYTKSVDDSPTPMEHQEAIRTITPNIVAQWHALFDDNAVDILMVPTTPLPARPIYAVEPYAELNGMWAPNYAYYGRTHGLDTVSRIPGISLPIGLNPAGLPIGLQFHARPLEDAALLQFALAAEGVLPTTPPPAAVPACKGCTPMVMKVNSTFPSEVVWGADPSEELPPVQGWALDLSGSCELKDTMDFPMYPPYSDMPEEEYATASSAP